MPRRSLAVQLLDAAFTPLTVAVELTAELPLVVARAQRAARERIEVARWVGEMAVGYGRSAIERRMSATGERAEDV